MNPELGRLRLLAQRLAGEHFDTPLEVAQWLCALQAQDYHQMLWALGSRMAGGGVAEVAAALERGEIARCWAIRGTMHLVAGADVRWMTALDAEKRIRADGRRLKQLGLVDADVDHAAQIAEGLLAGKGWVKRGELIAAWEGGGVDPVGQRGYHLLFHLAMRGLVCIGPQVDKEQGIGLIAEQLPTQRELVGEEARAEIALRYMRSHGPATLADFASWSGWMKGEAQRALAANGDALETMEIDGATYWRAAGDAPQDAAVDTPVLVAGFDEYLLGYRDRSAVLDPAHAGKVVPGGNGIFQPFIVDRCQVVGLWKRRVRRERVAIRIEPFLADETLEVRLRPEMERFARFHGLTPE